MFNNLHSVLFRAYRVKTEPSKNAGKRICLTMDTLVNRGVLMFWFALCHLFSSVVDLITLRQSPDVQKDIQILLLRQQVRVLQRKVRQPKRFSRLEKMLLAVLVAKLRRIASDFPAYVQPILIFSPDTVLRWHRELVRRK